MRDSKRIHAVIEELRTFWMANPDLRFFQMILALSMGKDLFHMEDDKVLELIKEKNK